MKAKYGWSVTRGGNLGPAGSWVVYRRDCPPWDLTIPTFDTREKARRYARAMRAVKVLGMKEDGTSLVRLNNHGDHQVVCASGTRIHFYTHEAAQRFFDAR